MCISNKSPGDIAAAVLGTMPCDYCGVIALEQGNQHGAIPVAAAAQNQLTPHPLGWNLKAASTGRGAES
jgi:hypothetical protein